VGRQFANTKISEEYIFWDACVYEIFACAVVKGTELTVIYKALCCACFLVETLARLCIYVLFVSLNVTNAFVNVRPNYKTLFLPVIYSCVPLRLWFFFYLPVICVPLGLCPFDCAGNLCASEALSCPFDFSLCH
jgi:hypothetical protein